MSEHRQTLFFTQSNRIPEGRLDNLRTARTRGANQVTPRRKIIRGRPAFAGLPLRGSRLTEAREIG